MIERLRTTITGIVSLDPQASRPNQKLLDDCADAVRLQLDCMQQEMLSPQRVSLELLLDVPPVLLVLDDEPPGPSPPHAKSAALLTSKPVSFMTRTMSEENRIANITLFLYSN